MVPWSYELGLIDWQSTHRKGIFACDLSDVYSNISGVMGMVHVREIHAKLSVPKGGPWHTLLNTPVFRTLWRQVVRDGRFRLAAWTAKVDADAVFLPQRLRDRLRSPALKVAQEGNGTFLSNCRDSVSMHGPLETMSRRAVEVFAAREGAECCFNGNAQVQCADGVPRLMQEDVYMHSCLVALGVKEAYDWTLLAEAQCHWSWNSSWCVSEHVAFHPFKRLSGFKTCLENAEEHGMWGSSTE